MVIPEAPVAAIRIASCKGESGDGSFCDCQLNEPATTFDPRPTRLVRRFHSVPASRAFRNASSPLGLSGDDMVYPSCSLCHGAKAVAVLGSTAANSGKCRSRTDFMPFSAIQSMPSFV